MYKTLLCFFYTLIEELIMNILFWNVGLSKSKNKNIKLITDFHADNYP